MPLPSGTVGVAPGTGFTGLGAFCPLLEPPAGTDAGLFGVVPLGVVPAPFGFG